VGHHRLRRVVVLGLCALLASSALGCGGDDDDQAAGGPTTTRAGASKAAPVDATTTSTDATATSVDACKLVPQADAETIAGTALEAGVSVQGDTASCMYAGPVTGPTAQVEVYIGPGAKKYLDIDRGLDHELQPVSGLGDESYLEDFTVFFRKGDTWVALRLVRLEDAPPYNERLITAARDLATKL
jgi:hypothetical protein